MKQKLISLLTLLLCVCSGAWAETETVTLVGGTEKVANNRTVAVPSITTSSPLITTGECGTTCSSDGYYLTNRDGKYVTYNSTNYYLCHTYNDGSKTIWKDSGTNNQYGTFTIPEGCAFTLKKVSHAMACVSGNFSVTITVKSGTTEKYKKTGISLSAVSDKSTITATEINIEEANWVVLTEGTYTINVSASNTDDKTGKYFGIAQVVLSGDLEVVKTITSQVFSGVKVDGETLSASNYDVDGTVITLKDSYILAPTVKLINTITYSDASEAEKEVAVSLTKNGLGTFFEGAATIGGTEYTVKVPVDNTVPLSTITWEFASQENSATMPVYAATQKIASGTYTLGSNVAFEDNADHCFVDSEGEDDVNVSRVKPSDASNNTILFTVTPTLGVSFIPTSVSFVAMKQGTNSEVTLNAAWVSAGQSDITLVSNAALKRASSSGTYATPGGDRFTYDLVSKGASTATGSFGLKLTLNTASKSYGIGEIIIQGYLVGDAVTSTVSVGAKGYATYVNSDYTLDFTGKSIKAYVASSNAAAKTVTLTQVNKLLKDTPVLLYSETNSDSQTIPAIADGEAETISENYFQKGDGSTAYTWAEDNRIYVLNTAGTPGFYKANNSTVATNKAYLLVPNNYTLARFAGLGFEDDGEATGIKSVETTTDGTVFNLRGQRVAQPQKGLYIMNGKKVVLK